MPDQFYQIAALTPEAEQMASQRVMLQDFLHLQRQRRKAAAHVGIARRQPHSNTGRDRDHRSVSSPRRSRNSTSTSTSRSTMTRRPFVLTTSIRPLPAAAFDGGGADVGTSGVITAGTKPSTRTPPRRPSRNNCRQRYSCERETSCFSAVADTWRPSPEKPSSTIRSFASSVNRRRR